jgi:hypothetical protein
LKKKVKGQSSHTRLTVVQCWLPQGQELDEKMQPIRQNGQLELDEKTQPILGQNGQLVHWWVLVYSGRTVEHDQCGIYL